MTDSSKTYNVLEEIRVERSRHEDTSGNDADDLRKDFSLSREAGCYALTARTTGEFYGGGCPVSWWPSSKDKWQPGNDAREQLLKAAALIVSEIERIDRLKLKDEGRSLRRVRCPDHLCENGLIMERFDDGMTIGHLHFNCDGAGYIYE